MSTVAEVILPQEENRLRAVAQKYGHSGRSYFAMGRRQAGCIAQKYGHSGRSYFAMGIR